MYGWILDGISSLFEPLAGQKPSERPGEEEKEAERQQQQRGGSVGNWSRAKAAKRSYHSIDTNEKVYKSEVEAKRYKRDVVVSFVKKTIAGVAGLLRLRRPPKNIQPQNEETQLVTPMGIDELHTSCISKPEWIMDKAGGMKLPFKSTSPPVMRKQSVTVDRERRGSLQLLPSRPSLRLGASSADPALSSGFGHSRAHKPSLTVEEAIRQNNKEHYRRLLEMVSEKYSKNQPLPFNQSKPQSELSSKSEPVTSWKPLSSKKPGQSGVFSWRNQTPKGRWCAATFTHSFTVGVEDAQTSRTSRTSKAADLDLSSEVAARLSLVDRAPSTLAAPEAHGRFSEEEVPRLNKEMAAEVALALAQKDPNLVLSAAFKLRITQRDLATLQEGSWLNDEVMNFYLSLVMDRSSSPGSPLKVFSFSTFFFAKLQGGAGGQAGGHSAVRRWTKAVDLFLYDLILVPLHLGVHWALAVIDLKSKTVKTYDSMGQRHDDICDLLLLYLQEEHRVKKGRDLDLSKWTIYSFRSQEIPQQKNGSDCGVFACKYADYISKDRRLSFKQCHMPLFRKLMIWEILNQKLL